MLIFCAKRVSVSYSKKVRSLYKRQPNTLVVMAFKNGSREQSARVAAPNLRMVMYFYHVGRVVECCIQCCELRFGIRNHI